MLVRNKERLYPPFPNIMTLERDGYYYYVSQDVYDQAVILSYKFKDDLNYFIDIFGMEFTDEVNMFLENAPEPINIFGPYLLLIKKGDVTPDMDQITGALHQIFSVTNALKIITVPAEVRANVSFTLSIYEEYHPSWDAFIQTCTMAAQPPASVLAAAPTAPIAPVAVSDESDDNDDDAFESSYNFDDVDDWDLDLTTEPADDDETDEKEDTSASDIPVVEPEPVDSEGNDLSGLNALFSAGGLL